VTTPRKPHPSRLQLGYAAGTTPERMTIQAARDEDGNLIPVADRNFTMTAYTGGRMRPRYWGDDVIVDIAGVKASAGAVPIVLDHMAYPEYVIGSADKVTYEGVIEASGKVTAVGAPALEAIDLADAGHELQCSIGCDELITTYVDAGASMMVNGQQQNGPFVLVSQATLREISVTVIGADGKTSFQLGPKPEAGSVAASRGSLPLPSNPVPLQGSLTVSTPTVPPPGAVDQIRLDAAAEVNRIATVNKLHASYSATPGVDRESLSVIQAKAIGEGWDAQKTELELLKASRTTMAPARLQVQATDVRTLEAAMVLQAGVKADLVEKEYGQEILNRASERSVRVNASFAGLFNTILATAGQPTSYGRLTSESIRATFEADRMLRASGGVSTYSLSGILSNIANKSLMAAYLTVDNTPLRAFGRDSTSDFKQVARYRMTAVGDFDKVAKDGQIKEATATDETFTNQVETYARKIGISRQDLINDDLGAFTQIGQHLGRKAAIRVHKLAFTVLLSNTGNFFHSNNKNLSTGGGSAFGIAGLTAAFELFMNQKDAAGDPVSIMPKYVLTAPANYVAAKQVFTDVTVNETTTADKGKPNSNPHRGMFEPLMSPWLATNSGITNALNARWFLLADPADVPCVSIIYLDGNESPVIESSDLDFDTLGVQFRGYLDVGAAYADFRGGVQSNGS
jgi:hypothetical protein